MDSIMTRHLGGSQSNLANVGCSVRIIQLPSDEIALVEPATAPLPPIVGTEVHPTWNGDNEKMN